MKNLIGSLIVGLHVIGMIGGMVWAVWQGHVLMFFVSLALPLGGAFYLLLETLL